MEPEEKVLILSLKSCVENLSEKKRDAYIGKLNELSPFGSADLNRILRANDNYKLIAEELVKLISIAVIPEFNKREYFTYDASDFKGSGERTELVLTLLQIVLDKLDKGQVETRKVLNIILPDLLILLSSNAEVSFWCSENVVKATHLTLEKVKNVFPCEDNSFNEMVFSSGHTSSVFGVYLRKINTRLRKANWMKNPNIHTSFEWMLKHVTFPHLSEFIDQVLPPSLNFVDDFNVENKCRGVRCLAHLIQNVTKEELRWYGRCDVIFDVLEKQLYTHDSNLIKILHPVILDLLPVFGKLPDSIENHHKIFLTILRDVEFESKILNRRALTSNLPNFIELLGISVVNHSKRLLKIFETYLEVYDGPEEIARLNILKTIQQFILVAWPRIPSHSLFLSKVLYKFMYDVTVDRTTTSSKVKAVLLSETKKCFVYLNKCDSKNVTNFIQSVDAIEVNVVLQIILADIKSTGSCEHFVSTDDSICELLERIKL